MDADQLRGLLIYEPDTGVFRNRVQRGNRGNIGEITGCPSGDGRKQIRINGKVYRTYRLAWLYMTGEWPKGEIDHKDRDPGNDRWENLRKATRVENMRNARILKNMSSGLKGVSFITARGKWRAEIRVGSKAHHLGYFLNREEAHAAYMQAADRLFGEFAAK